MHLIDHLIPEGRSVLGGWEVWTSIEQIANRACFVSITVVFNKSQDEHESMNQYESHANTRGLFFYCTCNIPASSIQTLFLVPRSLRFDKALHMHLDLQSLIVL